MQLHLVDLRLGGCTDLEKRLGVVPVFFVQGDLTVEDVLLGAVARRGARVADLRRAADTEFDGVIRSVEKTANQVTKLYTVTVTVPAEVEGLLSGMFADVTFHTAVSESAVVVPSEAILTSSDRQYVFIVENDTAKRVDITTGLTGSGMTEVTSGLDAGEQLVTVGQQYLSDGDAVRVVEG